MGCRFPGEEKRIKPLTVFTRVGLMLMCEGRPGDGGWEIDHWWTSVRGILTFTTAFHALRIHQAETEPSENTTIYHIDYDIVVCWSINSLVLYLIVQVIWQALLFVFVDIAAKWNWKHNSTLFANFRLVTLMFSSNVMFGENITLLLKAAFKIEFIPVHYFQGTEKLQHN